MKLKNITIRRPAFLCLSLLLASSPAWSWGERGHHLICEVATRLVTDPVLLRFAKARGHFMGHLCNIPDIHWKDLGDIAKPGDDTHFINPENLGWTLETVPLDLGKIISEKDGQYSELLKRNIIVTKDLGTSWWRYDQFYRRAILDGKSAKALEGDLGMIPPAGQANPAKDKFNAAVLGMFTNMGLMGHFIGDASQPFHNTFDYDGWKVQHGGIHNYYENLVVNELGLSLPNQIFQAAMTMKRSKESLPPVSSPVETIRFVAMKTFVDLPNILKLDPVLEPSQVTVNPDGTTKKIPAKRKPASDVALGFEAMIVQQMARSAMGLAQSWEQIYTEAGKPNLDLYASYKYPLTPAFVDLDYLKAGSSEARGNLRDKKKRKSKEAMERRDD